MSKYLFYTLLCFSLFALLTVAVVLGFTSPIDDGVTMNTGGYGLQIFRAISYIGGTYIIIPLSLIAILFLLFKKRFTSTLVFSMNLSVSFVIYQIIKEIVARPRPDIVSHTSPTIPFLSIYSYPSGHTVGTAVFFISVGIFIFDKEPTMNNILPLLSIPIMIGISMIALGYHYITDIISALLLSISIIYFNLYLEQKYDIDGLTEKIFSLLGISKETSD